ncbi:hypothetical protein [Pseudomonas veronii]|uniref:Uncharacterized protein n=1 Tax=Pseudomonas veronii TaxID=76761 RepID=A0ABS0VJT2_PSEVE|nr:hypothetical protein [Pseudomonas veronii]MBI6651781.1 hypothetical protein [Pseudomonas veronii]
MRKLLAASVFAFSFVGHAASAQLEPVRVQLLTERPDPIKGNQLVFEEPGGCFFTGTVNDERLVVINRKICPRITTNVSMVVPLDKKSSEAEATNNKSKLDWLTESNRNYNLFQSEAAVDPGNNREPQG